jgi:GT2 family glycosyltransferase
VALVNTDTRLHRDWLRSLLSFTAGGPRTASLQGLTLSYFDHDLIDSTHVFVDRSGYASQGGWHERLGGPLPAGPVFGVNAAACLITRAFIEAQPFPDLFDESMFMYLEDVDVALRATIMDWSSYFVPDATAYHMGSASTAGAAQLSRYAFYMTFRNNLGLLAKNLPWSILLKVLVRLPRADYRTIRRLLQTGERGAAGELVRGRLVSVVRLPVYLRKRARLRAVRTVEPDYLWSLMRTGRSDSVGTSAGARPAAAESR